MMTIRNIAVLITVILMKIWLSDCYVHLDYLNRKGIYLDAKVGSYVKLNCPLDFPQDIPIHIVHWHKDTRTQQWDPQEYGQETLRVYLVRWYREPGHFLHGTAETREHYYTVKNLNEGHVYTFQVFSLSNTDYQAGSNEFEIYVPPYRRVRAIAIGTTCALLLILTASALFL